MSKVGRAQEMSVSDLSSSRLRDIGIGPPSGPHSHINSGDRTEIKILLDRLQRAESELSTALAETQTQRRRVAFLEAACVRGPSSQCLTSDSVSREIRLLILTWSRSCCARAFARWRSFVPLSHSRMENMLLVREIRELETVISANGIQKDTNASISGMGSRSAVSALATDAPSRHSVLLKLVGGGSRYAGVTLNFVEIVIAWKRRMELRAFRCWKTEVTESRSTYKIHALTTVLEALEGKIQSLQRIVVDERYMRHSFGYRSILLSRGFSQWRCEVMTNKINDIAESRVQDAINAMDSENDEILSLNEKLVSSNECLKKVIKECYHFLMDYRLGDIVAVVSTNHTKDGLWFAFHRWSEVVWSARIDAALEEVAKVSSAKLDEYLALAKSDRYVLTRAVEDLENRWGHLNKEYNLFELSVAGVPHTRVSNIVRYLRKMKEDVSMSKTLISSATSRWKELHNEIAALETVVGERDAPEPVESFINDFSEKEELDILEDSRRRAVFTSTQQKRDIIVDEIAEEIAATTSLSQSQFPVDPPFDDLLRASATATSEARRARQLSELQRDVVVLTKQKLAMRSGISRSSTIRGGGGAVFGPATSIRENPNLTMSLTNAIGGSKIGTISRHSTATGASSLTHKKSFLGISARSSKDLSETAPVKGVPKRSIVSSSRR